MANEAHEAVSITMFFWIMGGLQAFTLLLVGWIKLDITDIWKRMNSHGHKIECDHDSCKPKTTGVLIHE